MPMDSFQRAHLLNCNYVIPQERGHVEMLTMEIEETRLIAQEELMLRDKQISQLKEMLTSVIKERDQALENVQKLSHEKLLVQKQMQIKQQIPISGISSSNNNMSSSDCDEISIVSSPRLTTSSSSELLGGRDEKDFPVATNKPLPEKGRFLQAVMKAGPLLQTLLLAGPLPRWRHPPPPLDTYQIPPPPVVADINMWRNVQDSLNMNHLSVSDGMNNRKRAFCNDDSDSGRELKYQRLNLQ